jgi:putative transcriptional regulator
MQKFKIEKGVFLVSEPFLPDPNFKRTVVLLTEHDEDGSIGFVLNRRTNLLLNDVLDDFPEFPSPLYVGGPVEQNTLHYIHLAHFDIPGSKPLMEGINWGGDFEVIKELVEERVLSLDDIRFFIGYSGWSPGQLAAEMEEKAWIIAQSDPGLVMDDPEDDIWKVILSGMGEPYKLMANYPEDPRLN